MSQTVEYYPERGYKVSGLFQDGDGLTMFRTKKQASDFARSAGWKGSDVERVWTPLFAGYAVAHTSRKNDRPTLVLLADDLTIRELYVLVYPRQRTQEA